MTDKPKREITLKDIKEATSTMDDIEYSQYMKLPLLQRLEVAREILDNLDKEGK